MISIISLSVIDMYFIFICIFNIYLHVSIYLYLKLFFLIIFFYGV